MLASGQLLTAPTSLPHYKPEEISSSALQLVSSSLLFWQDEHNRRADDQNERQMTPPHPQPQPQSTSRSRSRSRPDDTELWFFMSSSSRAEQTYSRQEQLPVRDQVPTPPPEPTAYQATSRRQLAHRSISPSRFASIPLISTSAQAINEPLPPSMDSDRKRHRHVSLRSLMNRRSGSDQVHMDPSRLQPRFFHQRESSTNLNLEPHQYTSHLQSSHSMPTSPIGYATPTQPPPVAPPRAHSASANYTDIESEEYTPYSERLQSPTRAVSMETYFEPQPPRLRRTFPEATSPSPISPREVSSDRPRPHTWLSSTDPNNAFHNASDVHLFAEATCGFSDSNWDFNNAVSPTSPPPLQGSLFSRVTQNDQIPLPLQNRPSPQPLQQSIWQSPSYGHHVPVQTSSSALSRSDSYQPSATSRVPDINIELERLGITEEDNPDDELPNYAQSQAEMANRRAKEARDRARELEARWNSSQGSSWRTR